jgi:hypothetical protein
MAEIWHTIAHIPRNPNREPRGRHTGESCQEATALEPQSYREVGSFALRHSARFQGNALGPSEKRTTE